MSYAERAAHEDCGAVYESLRQELIAIVRTATVEETERTVPASPAWRVIEKIEMRWLPGSAM